MFKKAKNDESYVISIEKELKKGERKAKFNKGLDNAAKWVAENAGYILVGSEIFAVAHGTLTPMVRGIMRSARQKREQDMKYLRIYDRSQAHYWSLKRKPTNSEWATIERRKQNGESLGNILKSMKILK